MNEQQKNAATQAVCDCVREALRENPETPASDLKAMAEAAGEAIVAGLAKLSAAT